MTIFVKHRSGPVLGRRSHGRNMLALMLLVHAATARDTQQEYPVFRNVSSCPEVGYYWRREPGENLVSDQCYLCFCQDDGMAICWKHQNMRCDLKNYVHDRKIRAKRSPGFADLFFQDAARDVLKMQTPEQCKPFQSSYSVGCPPADWCIGCTVCDCNANGRWDCHVLSFCPDDKKKGGKKRRTVVQPMKMKPPLRQATQKPKIPTISIPTPPKVKRTVATKPPARKYMSVASKTKGTTPTKATPKRYVQIESRRKGNVPAKPTTRRAAQSNINNNAPTKPTARKANQANMKKPVPTKPTLKKTIQTKPVIKKTMDTKPTIKRTVESKPVIKKTATRNPVNNTTVKLNKVRQINVKSQNANQTKIKPNHMVQINTKPRKEVLNKANNPPPKKPVSSAKPVQKKTITANVKPSLRSFQKVPGKPVTNNLIKNKTVVNVSSKFVKSAEKIINEKQKKLSKLINITDDEEPKGTMINNKSRFVQKNFTLIEMNKKLNEKVIKNYKAGPKRLSRKKRCTKSLFLKI